MKLTIDTTAKTIRIEEKVSVTELIDYLTTMNVNIEEYSIEPSIVLQYYPWFPTIPDYQIINTGTPYIPPSPTTIS